MRQGLKYGCALAAVLLGIQCWADAPSDPAEMVTLCYREVLERDPDPSGLSEFVGHLEQGKSLEWVSLALRNSEEGRKVAERRLKARMAGTTVVLLLAAVAAFIFIRTSGWKHRIFKLLMFAGSVAVGVLGIELGLRIKAASDDAHSREAWAALKEKNRPARDKKVSLRHMITPTLDSNTVYTFYPGMKVLFDDKRVTTDEQGCRVTPGHEDLEGRFLVMGLGDSVMFGWGVHDEETYLYYLARSLEASGQPVGVLNTAIPGYNTKMEVERLSQMLGDGIRPDLVLIHYVDNDLSLPSFIALESQRDRKHWELVSLYRAWRYREEPSKARHWFSRPPDNVPERYRHLVGESSVSGALEKLSRLSEDYGFQAAVLCNWEPPEFLDRTCRELGLPVIAFGEMLMQYCREHGIDQYLGSELTVSENDPHFSALGHQLVARRLFNQLEKQGHLAR